MFRTWQSFVRRHPRPSAARRQRAVRALLGLELLENRRLLVVGATAIPDALEPGGPYDGVVDLGGCTGTLLETGRHILTAGHCVAQNEAQRVAMLAVPSQGVFVLTFDGQSTAGIPWSASAATVETALEDLANVTNVAVSKTNALTWNITFRGNQELQNVPQMLVTSFVSGPSGAVPMVVTTTRQGTFSTTDSALFELVGGDFNISTDSHTVHPDWHHLYTSPHPGNAEAPAEPSGNDVAILRLNDGVIAPLGAQRYELYRDTDEIGRNFILVGYGNTGTGDTGANVNSIPKRLGLNTYGDIHDDSDALLSDFDDPDNPVGAPGLGDDEAALGPGDSGGPNFLLEGFQLMISGVNSATTGGGHGRFGVTNHFTRVSDYDTWIDSIIHAPDDVILDMTLQPDGDDGSHDTIVAQRFGPGNSQLRLLINGDLVWTQPVAEVLSLTIIGSEDDETINMLEVPSSISLVVNGNGGDDEVQGSNGEDTLTGGTGDDTIDGRSGADWIDGGTQNDTLIGSSGVDSLFGGAGNDQLIGGRRSSNPGVVPEFFGDSLVGGDGNDVIIGDSGSFLPLNVRPDAGGPDTIHGGTGSDLVFAQGGNDDVRGDSGDDFLYTQDGHDTVSGGSNDDFVNASNGDDLVNGDSGDDELLGGDGDDEILGGTGNDELNGGAQNDTLVGQAGSDTIHGGSGNDHLIGGVRIGSGLPNDLSGDVLNGDAGNDTIAGDNGSFLPLNVDPDVGGADTINGGSGTDLVFGQGGADDVDGGTENDFVYPQGGDDTVSGGGGDDYAFGGEGNDSLVGGDGNDELEGGQGDDFLAGDNDDDTLTGGTGDDSLDGGSGLDSLSGDQGADTQDGGPGDDLIDGGDDHDLLRGSEGNDELEGGAGNDILLGGAGDDRLLGQAGFDILIGGQDADTLWGAGGEDILISGETDFDSLPLVLGAIRDEWTSGHALDNRVQNLRGVDNPQFDVRLNGDSFLLPAVTVHDDAAADRLIGGGSTDWFFHDPDLDDLVDLLVGEFEN